MFNKQRLTILFFGRDVVSDDSLEDVLSRLRSSVIGSFEGRTVINIRRGHIWEDACRSLTRKRFDPRAGISVCFADDFGNHEGAVDVGGPRREFLRLLVKAVNESSGIFAGPENRRVLAPYAYGKTFCFERKVLLQFFYERATYKED